MMASYLLHYVNVWAVILPFMLYTIGIGFVAANTYANAMEDFSHIAGAAASAYGFIQVSGTFTIMWLVSQFHTEDQAGLAVTLLLLSVSAFIAFRYAKSEQLTPANEN